MLAAVSIGGDTMSPTGNSCDLAVESLSTDVGDLGCIRWTDSPIPRIYLKNTEDFARFWQMEPIRVRTPFLRWGHGGIRELPKARGLFFVSFNFNGFSELLYTFYMNYLTLVTTSSDK